MINCRTKLFFIVLLSMKSLVSMQSQELTLYSIPDKQEVAISNTLWKTVFPCLLLCCQQPTPVASIPEHALNFSSDTLGHIEQLLRAPMHEQEILKTYSSPTIRDLWRALAQLQCKPNTRLTHSVAHALAQRFYQDNQRPDFLTYFLNNRSEWLAYLTSLHKEWPRCIVHLTLYLYLLLNRNEQVLCAPYFNECISPLACIQECPDQAFIVSEATPELAKILRLGIHKRAYSAKDLQDFWRLIISEAGNLTPFVKPIFQQCEQYYQPPKSCWCCHTRSNSYLRPPETLLKKAACYFDVTKNNTALARLLAQHKIITPTNYLFEAYIHGLGLMVHTLLEYGANPLKRITNTLHTSLSTEMHAIASFSDDGRRSIPLVVHGTRQTILEKALLMYEEQRAQYQSTTSTDEAAGATTPEFQNKCKIMSDMCILMINYANKRYHHAFLQLLQENALVKDLVFLLVPEMKQLLEPATAGNFVRCPSHDASSAHGSQVAPA